MRRAAGFASEIQDPLRTPVYAWDSDEQLPLWSARRSWQGVVGYSQGCNADLGLEDFTVNYAFESCYNQIPSGLDIKSGKLLFDDDKPASWDNKLRNFYTALKFMRRAPLLDQMPETLGYSRNLWYQQGRRSTPLLHHYHPYQHHCYTHNHSCPPLLPHKARPSERHALFRAANFVDSGSKFQVP